MRIVKLVFIHFFIFCCLLSFRSPAQASFSSPKKKSNIAEGGLLPQKGDLLLNELLFNPSDGAPDFIELLNASADDIALHQVLVGTRKADGSYWLLHPISERELWLKAGKIIVLCEQPDTLSWIYPQACSENFWNCDTPRLNNDGGCALLLNADSVVIDELQYSSSWHHRWLNNQNGVSLERISTSRPTQEASNWQSAAAHVNFASPGCENSASMLPLDEAPEVSFSSELVSPNDDGFQDELSILFNLSPASWLLQMRVFDASGRLASIPFNNYALAAQASLSWNACLSPGAPLPTGMYALHLLVWNDEGERKEFKYACAVVR